MGDRMQNSTLCIAQPEKVLDFPTANEDDGVAIQGGLLKDTQYAWTSCGDIFKVIRTSTGLKVIEWKFGARLSNCRTSVTCVAEIRSENGSDPQFAIGIECDLYPGMVCFFGHTTQCWAQVIRAVQMPGKVLSLSVVSHDRMEDDESPLSSALCSMRGVLAVGLVGGQVVLLDMCQQDCVTSNEEAPARMMVLTVRDDYDEKAEEAEVNGDHLGLILNSGSYQDYRYMLQQPDGSVEFTRHMDKVCVTALLYVPQIASIVIGFNFGVFQIWDLINFCLHYTSPMPEHPMPLVALVFQEPSDDPRNYCYLWAVLSNNKPHRLPQIGMFALIYQKKDWIDGCGDLYTGFVSCLLSFEQVLGAEDRNTGVQFVCCNTSGQIATHRTTSHASFDVNNSYQCSRPDSSLCLFAWRSLDTGDVRLLLFDLNQWYKDHMPCTVARSIKVDSYLAMYRIAHTTHKPLLDVRIEPDSLAQFTAAMKLDEHYYPNAVTFRSICLFGGQIVPSTHAGIQREVLALLRNAGPLGVANPTILFKQCVNVGLRPLFIDVDKNIKMSVEKQREYLLSVALENHLDRLLNQCAVTWSNGCQEAVGGSLQLWLGWAWQRAHTCKNNVDSLCIALFNHTGTTLDTNSCRSLDQCSKQLNKLATLFKDVIAHCRKSYVVKLPSDMEVQAHCLSIVALYVKVIKWFNSNGLLPEYPEAMPPPSNSSILYPVQCLVKNYQARRAELGEIAVAAGHQTRVVSDCSDLLFIDGILRHECNGDQLCSLWERQGGSGNYPPPSLQSLLRIYLLDDIATHVKHSIVMYVLLDLAALLKQDGREVSIEQLQRFPRSFGLSTSLSRIAHGMWLLDHRDFADAVDMLLDPRVCAQDLAPWHHTLVLRALMFQGHCHLARKYYCSRKPSMKDEQDIRLVLSVLVSSGQVGDALYYQRNNRHQSNSAQLMRHFFSACLDNNEFGHALQYPLTPEEEDALANFLETLPGERGQDLQVFYFLGRSRFVEAINSNEHYRRVKPALRCSNTSSLRDALVDAYAKTLPAVTRELAKHCATKKNELNSWRQVARPATRPLSMNIRSHPAVSYKSTLIHESMQQAKDTWNVGIESTTGGFMEQLPFLCTPKSAALTSALASCVPPVVFPTQVMSATGSHSALSIGKRKRNSSSDAALLLHTPHVRRTSQECHSTSKQQPTPHSILKNSQPRQFLASENQSRLRKGSATTLDDLEESPPPVVVPRQIRFSFGQPSPKTTEAVRQPTPPRATFDLESESEDEIEHTTEKTRFTFPRELTFQSKMKPDVTSSSSQFSLRHESTIHGEMEQTASRSSDDGTLPAKHARFSVGDDSESIRSTAKNTVLYSERTMVETETAPTPRQLRFDVSGTSTERPSSHRSPGQSFLGGTPRRPLQVTPQKSALSSIAETLQTIPKEPKIRSLLRLTPDGTDGHGLFHSSGSEASSKLDVEDVEMVEDESDTESITIQEQLSSLVSYINDVQKTDNSRITPELVSTRPSSVSQVTFSSERVTTRAFSIGQASSVSPSLLSSLHSTPQSMEFDERDGSVGKRKRTRSDFEDGGKEQEIQKKSTSIAFTPTSDGDELDITPVLLSSSSYDRLPAPVDGNVSAEVMDRSSPPSSQVLSSDQWTGTELSEDPLGGDALLNDSLSQGEQNALDKDREVVEEVIVSEVGTEKDSSLLDTEPESCAVLTKPESSEVDLELDNSEVEEKDIGENADNDVDLYDDMITDKAVTVQRKNEEEAEEETPSLCVLQSVVVDRSDGIELLDYEANASEDENVEMTEDISVGKTDSIEEEVEDEEPSDIDENSSDLDEEQSETESEYFDEANFAVDDPQTIPLQRPIVKVVPAPQQHDDSSSDVVCLESSDDEMDVKVPVASRQSSGPGGRIPNVAQVITSMMMHDESDEDDLEEEDDEDDLEEEDLDEEDQGVEDVDEEDQGVEDVDEEDQVVEDVEEEDEEMSEKGEEADKNYEIVDIQQVLDGKVNQSEVDEEESGKGISVSEIEEKVSDKECEPDMSIELEIGKEEDQCEPEVMKETNTHSPQLTVVDAIESTKEGLPSELVVVEETNINHTHINVIADITSSPDSKAANVNKSIYVEELSIIEVDKPDPSVVIIDQSEVPDHIECKSKEMDGSVDLNTAVVSDSIDSPSPIKDESGTEKYTLRENILDDATDASKETKALHKSEVVDDLLSPTKDSGEVSHASDLLNVAVIEEPSGDAVEESLEIAMDVDKSGTVGEISNEGETSSDKIQGENDKTEAMADSVVISDINVEKDKMEVGKVEVVNPQVHNDDTPLQIRRTTRASARFGGIDSSLNEAEVVTPSYPKHRKAKSSIVTSPTDPDQLTEGKCIEAKSSLDLSKLTPARTKSPVPSSSNSKVGTPMSRKSFSVTSEGSAKRSTRSSGLFNPLKETSNEIVNLPKITRPKSVEGGNIKKPSIGRRALSEHGSISKVPNIVPRVSILSTSRVVMGSDSDTVSTSPSSSRTNLEEFALSRRLTRLQRTILERSSDSSFKSQSNSEGPSPHAVEVLSQSADEAEGDDSASVASSEASTVPRKTRSAKPRSKQGSLPPVDEAASPSVVSPHSIAESGSASESGRPRRNAFKKACEALSGSPASSRISTRHHGSSVSTARGEEVGPSEISDTCSEMSVQSIQSMNGRRSKQLRMSLKTSSLDGSPRTTRNSVELAKRAMQALEQQVAGTSGHHLHTIAEESATNVEGGKAPRARKAQERKTRKTLGDHFISPLTAEERRIGAERRKTVLSLLKPAGAVPQTRLSYSALRSRKVFDMPNKKK